MSIKWGRSFTALNWTQFFGAFNDNVFRWLMTFFVIDIWKKSGMAEGTIVSVAAAVFILPFLLFSDAGGVLADRHSKGRMIKYIKLAEIIIMGIGAVGFFTANSCILLIALFLMSTQSAFFGPVKYGIIPEIVESERLSKGNGKLAAMTFSAIILGSFCASLLWKAHLHYKIHCGFLSLSCVLFAVLGYIACQGIENTKPGGGKRKISWQFYREVYLTFKGMRNQPYMLAAGIGLSAFWLVAIFLNNQLVPFVENVLGRSKEDATLLFLLVNLGIGVGSWLAGRISGKLIEFGIVPVGAFGLALGLLLMFFCASVLSVGVVLVLFGVAAGFFSLPLNAYLQWKAPESQRGQILAAVNFLNFLGMLIAAFMGIGCGAAGISAKHSFLIGATMMGLLMLYALIMLPDFLIRFVLLVVTRCKSKISVEEDVALPLEEGTLLIADSLDMQTRLAISSTQQRRIRCVIPQDEIFWWNRWYFRLMKMIPVDGNNLTERIRKMVEDGFVVCMSEDIFKGIDGGELATNRVSVQVAEGGPRNRISVRFY